MMHRQAADKKLNVSQVVRLTGLSRRALLQIPHELPFLEVKAGEKTIRRYNESDVQRFIQENTRR